MYLIVGLGNPEEEYSKTRHNMGFDTINVLSKKYNIEIDKKKFNGLYGLGQIGTEKVILLKPQTYMNLSGIAVRECMKFYKISKENLIVIYDDLDIEPGTIKIRKKGGAGTHNGMKSVVSEISTEEFCRIRIGIGEPKFKNDLLNYLLTTIPDDEYKILKKAIENASQTIFEILNSNIDIAMNKYN